jgi:beta-lactamase class C
MIKKCVFLLLALVIGVVHANNNSVQSTNTQIAQLLNKAMEQEQIPGMAVEVINQGQTASYLFGPVTRNTLFHLGSLTELMTSLLFAQQIDAAKLRLNTPVKQFLPNLTSDDFDDMRLENLATHTSGLPLAIPATIKTQPEMEAYLNKWYPDNVVDLEWEYSHIGMGLLGSALESSTHKKLNDLYQRDIFSRLGMKTATMQVSAKNQPNLLSGAWGLQASATDMHHFLSAAIGLPGTPETILYPIRMTQAAFVVLPKSMQGLGWQIYPLENGGIAELALEQQKQIDVVEIHEIPAKAIYKPNALLEKASSFQGQSAYIALIPGKKTGVVILLNKQMSQDDLKALGRHILLIALQSNQHA